MINHLMGEEEGMLFMRQRKKQGFRKLRKVIFLYSITVIQSIREIEKKLTEILNDQSFDGGGGRDALHGTTKKAGISKTSLVNLSIFHNCYPKYQRNGRKTHRDLK
jgi:hypothetical protein